MDFGNLLFPLPSTTKKKIREIEKAFYKLNGIITAITFNKVCLKEDLFLKYFNLCLHDPDARATSATFNFRRDLVRRQLDIKKQDERKALERLQRLHQEWDALGEHHNREDIHCALHTLRDQDYARRERTIYKKLVRCIGGHLRIPSKESTAYVNLADYIPTAAEHSLLQMDLNCHVLERPKPGAKRVEIEVLLDSIFALEDRGRLKVSDDLQPLLLAEALTERGSHRSQLMTREMRDVARGLRDRQDIVIRRADKSAAFYLD